MIQPTQDFFNRVFGTHRVMFSGFSLTITIQFLGVLATGYAHARPFA